MDNITNLSRGKVSPLGMISPPYVCPNYHSGWKT